MSGFLRPFGGGMAQDGVRHGCRKLSDMEMKMKYLFLVTEAFTGQQAGKQ